LFLVVLAAVGLYAGPPPETADSLDAIKHVQYLLSQYYPFRGSDNARRTRLSFDVRGSATEERCDGDRGDVCFADDSDAGSCPNFVQCHRNPDHMIEVMAKAAGDYPASGYLGGQAVYALTKQGRLPEAARIAERCSAAAWWCDALRGYVLHAQGRDPEAEAAFRRALSAAPDSVACDWSDATWLMGSFDQRGYGLSTVDARDAVSDWSCPRRVAVSDSIWWLADPLYSVPGNSRWVEHLARSMSARFYDEIRRSHVGSQGSEAAREHRWASRLRRGPVDSYDVRQGWTWTSREAARYHFVPDVPVDDLADPTWRLEGHLDDEGYTPFDEPFVEIPYQAARFRDGDSLKVAVASRLTDTPVEGALDGAASYVLSAGPRSAPVILTANPHQKRVRFTGTVAMRDYVSSLEVVTSKAVGWDRRLLTPLSPVGPEVSDLLLYDSLGTKEAAGFGAAARVMRGSTDLTKGDVLGVYWETYGAPSGANLEFELSVERRSGGVVDRLRGLLPGGSQEGPGRVTWTEPATGGTHSSAVALNLGTLDSGEYTLVLQVAWGEGLPLRRTREIRVE